MSKLLPSVLSLFLLIAITAIPIPADESDHATRFTINSRDDIAELEIRPGVDSTSRRFRFVPRDAGYNSSGGEDAEIAIPARRIAVLSSSIITHFVDLDAVGAIVAVDDRSTIYNASIRRQIDSGRIAVVGTGPSIDRERLIAARPDLVLYSPFGPDDPVAPVLERAGIPSVPLVDWREPTPLARMEWIRVVGALVGQDERANQIYEDRRARYHYLADLTANVRDKPRVLVNAPWRGQWPVPGATSFIGRYIRDAGGEYLFTEITDETTRFLDLEVILARGSTADIWINLNAGWSSARDIVSADPRLAALAPFQNGEVYHYSVRERPDGANDFWESGAARPDQVLADLISIFHPSVLPEHQRVYYRNVLR